MIVKVAGSAWLGAQLLTLALFLPGGTLVVLALMLARRFSPATLGRLLVGLSFLGKNRRHPAAIFWPLPCPGDWHEPARG